MATLEERLSYIKHLKTFKIRLDAEILYRDNDKQKPKQFIYFNFKELLNYIYAIERTINEENSNIQLQLIKHNNRR